MEMFYLPEIVKFNLNRLISDDGLSFLRKEYERISDSYKRQCFKEDVSYSEALSYACARMPATYSASMYVLEEFFRKKKNFRIGSVLDIGSGTGALVFALVSHHTICEYTAVERSISMKKVFQQLIVNSGINITLINESIFSFLKINRKQYDCSFFVYSFNELHDGMRVLREVDKITRQFIFIIEPGTPSGFNNIKAIKKFARENDYTVIAPCANDVCPIQGKDWCHFSVRTPRTINHAFLKSAKLSYEDEKFCYVILSKKRSDIISENRIVKRPMKKKGHIIFDICTNKGLSRVVIPSKKITKNKTWGEEL